MQTFQKGELAKQILGLALAGGLVAGLAVMPGLSVLFAHLKARDTYERKRVKNALRRLEDSGYIKRRIRRGREEFVVTKKGERLTTKYLMGELEISRPKRWDGKWRILMFDIPEKKKALRDQVSEQLRVIGMRAVQHSVFVSPFPCQQEVDTIIDFHGLGRHFLYFEAETYEGTEDLLQDFKLR